MTETKPIYLMLCHTGSFPAKLVQFMTGCIFSHVSLSFDEELTHLYSFGRKRKYNFLIGGFVVDSIGSGIFKRFPNTECRVQELWIEEEQYKRLYSKITNMVLNKERYHYSFLGTIFATFRIPFRRETCMYCSEFVREVLEKSGVDVSHIPEACHPMDFIDFPDAITIFEGKLIDYPKRKKR